MTKQPLMFLLIIGLSLLFSGVVSAEYAAGDRSEENLKLGPASPTTFEDYALVAFCHGKEANKRDVFDVKGIIQYLQGAEDHAKKAVKIGSDNSDVVEMLTKAAPLYKISADHLIGGKIGSTTKSERARSKANKQMRKVQKSFGFKCKKSEEYVTTTD